MTQNLFNGLPPRVVTYIKIHLRYIFSTGLFSYQEREDLIQDLVLFYLERFYRKKEVPDDYLFVSIKTKAQQILRTRLRQLQSGFFATESLNSMCEEEGFEATSDFSLSTLENKISIRELKSIVSDKEWQFIRLILFGFTNDEATSKAHVSKNVLGNIRDMPPSGGFFYVFIAVEFSGRRKICRKRVPSLTETAFPMSGSSQWP